MGINQQSLLAILCGLGLSFGASAADYGQNNNQQSQAAQQQRIQPAKNVDEQSLNQFKDAFGEVNSIRQNFAGKLKNVEDPKKARQLQKQAQQDMVGAVENAGLTVKKYNQIFAAVQQSPELQKKVLGKQ